MDKYVEYILVTCIYVCICINRLCKEKGRLCGTWQAIIGSLVPVLSSITILLLVTAMFALLAQDLYGPSPPASPSTFISIYLDLDMLSVSTCFLLDLLPMLASPHACILTCSLCLNLDMLSI